MGIPEIVKRIILNDSGEEGLRILELIRRQREVSLSSKEISEKTGIPEKQTQIILNKLNKMGLVKYTLKEERPRWIISYWHYNEDGIIPLLIRRLRKTIRILNTLITSYSDEAALFYCTNCKRAIITFDQFFKLGSCPYCKSYSLEQVSKDILIKILEATINRLNKILCILSRGRRI